MCGASAKISDIKQHHHSVAVGNFSLSAEGNCHFVQIVLRRDASFSSSYY